MSPPGSPRPAATATVVPLSRAGIGRPHVVLAVDGPGRSELEREGVLPGTVVVVAARTPLGGPLVVELGRTRLALSADIASRVAVAVAGPGDRTG